jgi:nitrate/nitrite transporter NarK
VPSVIPDVQPRSVPVLLLLFTVATIGGSYLPQCYGRWPTEYLSKSAAAVAMGMINAVGSIPGFAGPCLFGYLSTKAGSFGIGLTILMAMSLAVGLIVLYVPNKKV